MRGSTLLIIACMIVGIAVLAGLGTWQVNRLFWKEELIAKVEARTKLAPMNLHDFLDRQMLEDNWPYSPVSVEGVFDHSKEVYFYATGKGGAAGWNVHTPLTLKNGKVLIVNRGFVPYSFKSPSERQDGQVAGKQTITGLVRVPLADKPNSFIPDNAPEKREFYWRSLPQMAELMTNGSEEFVPFFVDADDTPVPGGFPHGGTTIISFPNNHLQYALTWYGLALALLGVGTFFLISRRENKHE
ncbi:MAG: SURF1 family protein [Pseudomonadota bacterium]